jgi:hypothetical protein
MFQRIFGRLAQFFDQRYSFSAFQIIAIEKLFQRPFVTN